MPLTPEERKKAARAALKTGDPEYATGTITKPKMTSTQEARYDAAVAGHQSQLAQEEPDYAQHEFDPLPPAAKTAGEVAAGFTPAGVALDSYYMKEAIEEGSPGGIAMAGLAFIPLVGEMKKLLPKQLSKLAKEAGDTRPISEIVEDAVSLRGGPKSHTIENELGLKPGKLFHSKNPKEVLEHYSSAPIPEHEARSLGKANTWMADWEEDGSKLPEVIEYIEKVSRGRRHTPQEQRAILDWFEDTAPGGY